MSLVRPLRLTSHLLLALSFAASSVRAEAASSYSPQSAEPYAFAVTEALRDLRDTPLPQERLDRMRAKQERMEKNPSNTRPIRPPQDPGMTGEFVDPAIDNFKLSQPEAVTNPLQNFDGPDMDTVATLFGGGRFAPPDTNAAVGPNHVVITTNGSIQVFSKTGVAAGPAVRMSTLLAGIANAADDDGDPIVLYDQLADRWFISQFNLRFTAAGEMHMHIAVSATPDPTGTWFAYDFLTAPGRFTDYPHVGVWPDGYYMSSNDFNQSATAFLGAGLYAFERAKMLVGDPTASVIFFTTGPTHGGMLPSNLQGFTVPPAGTPNVFMEFDADEFGAPFDLVRPFIFAVDFAVPANSTLTQGPDLATAAFDARQPASRADMQQPAPSVASDSLDAIADRLMHPLNFRVLSGGVQSMVMNFTVNVSGVNPTNSATYQGGVRWMELRRDAGSGAITINQQATYAPGSGNPTGRDLWMSGIAQDGEGNIALASSATNSTATPALLNPTAVYTGRLAGDPVNTLPQGEVDALTAVIKGVQTGTSGRWGDYSSLFVDPSDDCTFWGAFEYVDSPTANFDWNTRIFSFKVNPSCVTPPLGAIQGTITNCVSGLPISGVTVTATGGYLRATGVPGTYDMDPVAAGTYTVQATKAFYSTATTNNVVVSAGGTATVDMCLVGIPDIHPAGSTLTNEGCVAPNGAIDPGETVTVDFCVQNAGGADTVNAVGTLQATGGVTAPSGPQNYGVVVAGGADVCRSFTFLATGSCGGTITASLQVQDGANDLGTVTYDFDLGALGAPVTTTYSSGNIAVPIPDVSQVEVPIAVPDTGVVADVNVRVRLNHTFDGDLVLTLVAPDGTLIALANNRGGSGANYGTGANDCSGVHTVFDDAAANPISAGTAPFAGTFRPEVPLAGVNSLNVNGIWKLRVADTAALDVGTIGCVSFEITRQPRVCCVGPVCTLTCPPDQLFNNDAGVCGAAVAYPAPGTAGTCGTVTCAPPAGGVFPAEVTTPVSCTSSIGGAACSFNVTVEDVEPPVLACPADIEQQLPPGETDGVVTFADPTVTDNCPAAGAPVCVPASGSSFPGEATTPVNCTAQDGAGNTGSCSFNVTLSSVSILEIPTLSSTGIAVLLAAFATAGMLLLRRRRSQS